MEVNRSGDIVFDFPLRQAALNSFHNLLRSSSVIITLDSVDGFVRHFLVVRLPMLLPPAVNDALDVDVVWAGFPFVVKVDVLAVRER